MSSATSPASAKSAVLLVGSGYGALKVAEDLAQSGIPVVWVTRAPHFLELPGGTARFPEWPEDLNFQFRPLYLRVTRHPLVTPITRGNLESLERGPEGFSAVVVREPHYIDYDLCTGCGRCMEVCPLQESDHPPLTRSPAYCPSRALELDKRKLSSCRVSCPLGVNVQAYLALTAAGRFDEALAVIREDNPLPGVCGRVCHHPCEENCRRADLDQAVAIRDLKRFLADREVQEKRPPVFAPSAQPKSERVAVIGSGPAGLTAAHFLARAGFPVTVFETMPEAGGMLRAGINTFRLPRAVLDRELEAIKAEGVEIKTRAQVGSLDELFGQGFAAVAVCTGTHQDLHLNIPGEDLEGVLHCVKFLSRVNLAGIGQVGPRTVVIGGGNSAMDAARTALRLGASEVTVLAIETEAELPAHPREVREAREEGVKFRLGAAPVALTGDEGFLKQIVAEPARWSEPAAAGARRIEYDAANKFTLAADTVIVAIGQVPHLAETGLDKQIETGRGGRIVVDEKLAASRAHVFAAGDVVTGPSTVINAMAAGRRVAGKIIEHLTGQPSPFPELNQEGRGVGDYVAISEDAPRQWRPVMAQRQPKARLRDFLEVDFGFTADQAVSEARRCLQCASCCECRVCETVCADLGAINHFRGLETLTVQSPAVIVADPLELPDAKILGAPDVYQVGDYQRSPDLMDVMVAGSAAAGQAMAKAVSLRPESAPDHPALAPEAEGELRLGVFVCTCNNTLAPPAVLERIRALGAQGPGVLSSELIFSACHPRGADAIARTVRSQRLNRVILASCVCCPLDFQCISCNDQRTRARLHLFDRLGLSRSQFEMINLKDHLLAAEQTEDEIFERARELLRGAFIRARFMGPLSQGVSKLGSNILILGGSEVGLSCALNLELQGFKVRLVHRCLIKGAPELPEAIRNRPPALDRGRTILHVPAAVIEKISGQVGDFTVTLSENGTRHRWKADIVCLTDENLLALAIDENMTGLKKFYRYDFAFFHTPQVGLYRVMPRTLQRVNAFEAGAALAGQVARAAAEAFMKDHELSPRVDPELCRGCGRCAEICPFDAIRLESDDQGLFTAQVVRHNCVGCGGCVGRCPVTAMDMPYFSNQVLDEFVARTLAEEF